MEENTKIVLPAIAVRGIVPLPSNEFRIEVGRINSIQALEAAEKMYGGNIVLLIQKDSTATEISKDDIEKVGVLAKIILKLKLPNGNYKVKFKISNRIEVKEYTSVDPYFVVNYEKIFSILENSDYELALMNNVSQEISKGANNLLTSPEEVSKLLQQGVNGDILSDVIAYQLKVNSNLSKYRFLEELSVVRRLQMIIEEIERERQIVEIENKINKDVKKYL